VNVNAELINFMREQERPFSSPLGPTASSCFKGFFSPFNEFNQLIDENPIMCFLLPLGEYEKEEIG